jgi:hypothetical protein
VFVVGACELGSHLSPLLQPLTIIVVFTTLVTGWVYALIESDAYVLAAVSGGCLGWRILQASAADKELMSAIGRTCAISGGDTDPTRCTAEGDGLFACRLGTAAEFFVVAYVTTRVLG